MSINIDKIVRGAGQDESSEQNYTPAIDLRFVKAIDVTAVLVSRPVVRDDGYTFKILANGKKYNCYQDLHGVTYLYTTDPNHGTIHEATVSTNAQGITKRQNGNGTTDYFDKKGRYLGTDDPNRGMCTVPPHVAAEQLSRKASRNILPRIPKQLRRKMRNPFKKKGNVPQKLVKADAISIPKKGKIIKTEESQTNIRLVGVSGADVSAEVVSQVAVAAIPVLGSITPYVFVGRGSTFVPTTSNGNEVSTASIGAGLGQTPVSQTSTENSSRLQLASGMTFMGYPFVQQVSRDSSEPGFVSERSSSGRSGRSINVFGLRLTFGEFNPMSISPDSEQVFVSFSQAGSGYRSKSISPFARRSRKPKLKLKLSTMNNPLLASLIAFGRNGTGDPLLIKPMFTAIPVVPSRGGNVEGVRREQQLVADASDPEQTDDQPDDEGDKDRGGDHQQQDEDSLPA